MDMPKTYVQLAEATPLFRGIGDADIAKLLQTPGIRVETYAKGGMLYTTDTNAHCLGFLVSGSARVIKCDGTGKMLMSVLHAGDIFGAASLFSSDDRYVANIIAMSETKALLIPEEIWLSILQSDFRIVKNYMAYLTSRIRFLSGRIDRLSQPTVEDRVLSFLRTRAKDNVYHPEMSLRAIGDALCISRTSLYRAFDTLTADGKIHKEGRDIRLIQEEEK